MGNSGTADAPAGELLAGAEAVPQEHNPPGAAGAQATQLPPHVQACTEWPASKVIAFQQITSKTTFKNMPESIASLQHPGIKFTAAALFRAVMAQGGREGVRALSSDMCPDACSHRAGAPRFLAMVL